MKVVNLYVFKFLLNISSDFVFCSILQEKIKLNKSLLF